MSSYSSFRTVGKVSSRLDLQHANAVFAVVNVDSHPRQFIMTFKILPVNYDVDMEQIATIDIASFVSSTKDLEDVLFPPNTAHEDNCRLTVTPFLRQE